MCRTSMLSVRMEAIRTRAITKVKGSIYTMVRPSDRSSATPLTRNSLGSRLVCLTDFNNKGARYSSALSSADLYRDDPFASTPSHIGRGGVGHGHNKGSSYSATPTSPDGTSHAGRGRTDPDLVVMPKLGQDWQDQEAARDKKWEGKMGGSALHLKSKRRNAARGVGSWVRGERKLCGWLGWRQGVFLAFFLLVGCAICLSLFTGRSSSLNGQKIFSRTTQHRDHALLCHP